MLNYDQIIEYARWRLEVRIERRAREMAAILDAETTFLRRSMAQKFRYLERDIRELLRKTGPRQSISRRPP